MEVLSRKRIGLMCLMTAVVFAVLMLTACGKDIEPSDTNREPSHPVAESPAPEQEATQAAAPAPDPEPAAAEPAKPEESSGTAECYAGSNRVISMPYYGSPTMGPDGTHFRTIPDNTGYEIWTTLPCVLK